MAVEHTYTYTARSADKTSKVLTFTIRGNRLSTDLGPPLEHAGRSSSEEGSLLQTVMPMVKPTALWAMEQGFNTFHLRDVEPHYDEGGSLLLRMWVRVGGLRAFPIHVGFNEVDNPDAAQAFAERIEQRQTELGHPGPFSGLLDYWFSWLVAVGTVLFLLSQQVSGDDER